MQNAFKYNFTYTFKATFLLKTRVHAEFHLQFYPPLYSVLNTNQQCPISSIHFRLCMLYKYAPMQALNSSLIHQLTPSVRIYTNLPKVYLDFVFR